MERANAKLKFTSDIEEGTRILKSGGIIIFPTDTVWGVGCVFDNPMSIQKLYKIKKRGKGKPTSLLIPDTSWVGKLSVSSNKGLHDLTERFWPGALTIVVRAREGLVPKEILGGDGTVGLRLPNHHNLLKLLSLVGRPILGPSANFAGEKPPVKLQDIDPKFVSMADLVFVAKEGKGVPSTVVDATGKKLKILRAGAVTI